MDLGEKYDLSQIVTQEEVLMNDPSIAVIIFSVLKISGGMEA